MVYSRSSTILISLLYTVIMLGCERAGPLETDPNTATLSQIQTQIFDTSCALSNCHAGDRPQQGMNLSAGLAYENIVGVASMEQPGVLRVAPGDPEGSYLLRKIRGDAGISASRMPLGGSKLSDDKIELVRRWIEEGALDN